MGQHVARLFRLGPESISAIDNAWLRMGNPGMVINTLFHFDEVVEPQRLIDHLYRKMTSIERFRCVPRQRTWQEQSVIKTSRHFTVHAQEVRSQQAFDQLMGSLVSQPLDESQPLWQFHVLKDVDGCSVLLMRTHHGYADGAALVGVLQVLNDEPLPATLALSGAGSKHARLSELKWLKYMFDLLKILTLLPDSRTLYKGRATPDKQTVVSDSVPLARLKAVGKHFDCTINDVASACISGGLRRYMQQHGGNPDKSTLRVTVPANLRTRTEQDRIGNVFGHYFLNLPIDEASPVKRLRSTKQRMQALKDRLHPLVVYDFLGVLGWLPRAVQQTMLAISANSTTAVMSNVVGPAQQLRYAGYGVAELSFLVPHGEMGMGISTISYHQQVKFGVAINKDKIARPRELVDLILQELMALEEQIVN
ncbi:WS/DGAT domain-containing protein [Pseudomonas sp. J452]|uniref:WS/DGAT domain-containing protein n=1 Tax=Pseudomonas sp. J452 TaxID=2898441 RepID=UPI0021ADBFFD|nr:WS/DGAT domain-containing protein [Pseudomonas sp. J452]UUY08377.1 WS/DGAT domain-containing protein [Pseudomonas sp. J452]